MRGRLAREVFLEATTRELRVLLKLGYVGAAEPRPAPHFALTLLHSTSWRQFHCFVVVRWNPANYRNWISQDPFWFEDEAVTIRTQALTSYLRTSRVCGRNVFGHSVLARCSFWRSPHLGASPLLRRGRARSPRAHAPLKGGYPAKLKKVLIVTAPLWFKAPFRILRLFVREKLRERVHTVNAPQLGLHVPRGSLPRQLGGLLDIDHAAWLDHCKNCFTNNLQNAKLDGVINEYVISNHIPPAKTQNGVIQHAVQPDMSSERLGADADMHISGERDAPYTCDTSPLRHSHNFNGENNSLKGKQINSGDEDDIDISTGRTWSDAEQSPGLSDEECGGAGGGAGLTPAQLLARVRALGRRGLVTEYEEIRARPPHGTFHHAKLPSNAAKNRYTDVLCYDNTRVVLSQIDPDDPTTDYINANYVDGYKQKLSSIPFNFLDLFTEEFIDLMRKNLLPV
ncbi:Tyrosine-protein phosphatase non-receptor type 9 [Eumeta japonica]|uniref:Tyrosine-protein phosphatase non-receptor type 9 n=1 Tax=Eumeta variegata TaxID=151549 RepID=A0A4C1T352_EUMVA|nr:Tyrosine-protein phosphatase non-receptor type 9 [Eumeta japonica]